MNYLTDIGELTIYVKHLVDEGKTDFFNEKFFEFLKEEKTQEYEKILNENNFNYINGKRDGQNGYGSKNLNKQISEWVAEKAKEYLQPGQNEIPNEREMLSETQIATTFSAFANGIAQNYQSADQKFFKYKEIRPIIRTKHFKKTMNSNLNLTLETTPYFIEKTNQTFNEEFIEDIKQNNVRQYVVENLKGEVRQFLNHIDNNKKDTIYTKQDLETKL